MNRLAKLQLIGPVFLFAAVLAAEAGAYALSAFPELRAALVRQSEIVRDVPA